MERAGELPTAGKDLGSSAVRGEAVAVPATMFHDEGAVARCFFCGRYTLDPATLGTVRVPLCECGKPHGWSGSFKPPGADAVWSGSMGPAAVPVATFSVSPRAADAPSELLEDQRIVDLYRESFNSMIGRLRDAPKHVPDTVLVFARAIEAEVRKSRAADALDSQPTVAAQQGSIADDARYLGLLHNVRHSTDEDSARTLLSGYINSLLDSRASSAPVAPIAPVAADVRCRFERWASTVWEYNLTPARDNSRDSYMSSETETAWMAWEAAFESQQEGSEAGNG